MEAFIGTVPRLRPLAGASLALLALGCAPATAVRMREQEDEHSALARSVAALWPLPEQDWHLSFKSPEEEGGGQGVFEEADTVILSRPAQRAANSSTQKAVRSNAAAAKPKLIFYNGLYGSVGGYECPMPCKGTADPEAIPTADALVWNVGADNHWADPPEQKPPGQRWVFSAFFEPPNRNARFEYRKRAETAKVDEHGLVDWTMTFRPDSDFLWPMARLVPINWHPGVDLPAGSKLTAEEQRDKERLTREEIGKNLQRLKSDLNVPRRKIVLAMVSNCVQERLEFLHRLKAALPAGAMDIMGACGQGSPCKTKNESDVCHQFLFRQYRFFAAFENRRLTGYISEKFFRGLLEGMVPLAQGGRSKADYAALGVPDDAYVHVDDFASVQELADFLVNMDDLKYLTYFAWRKTLRVATTMQTRKHAFCQLCKELHKDKKNQTRSRKFGNQLLKSWFQQYKGKYLTLA